MFQSRIRVWNQKANTMIYPKSYSIRNMKGRLCVRIWIEKEEDFYSKKKYNKTEPFDSFDYMYSTLAMAKNGEIFEGDIIAFGSSLNDIGIVEFSRVTGGFVTLVHGKIIQIRGNMRNCEILGDLFQDRFLLRRVRENMVAAKKQFMENLKEKGVDALTPESPKRADEIPKRAVPTFEEEVQDIIKEESSSVVQEEHLPKEEEALKQEIPQNLEGAKAEIEKKTPEKKEVLAEEVPMKTGDAALSLLKNLVSKKEEQAKVKEEVSSKKKEEEKQDQKESKKPKKEERVLDIKEERIEEPKSLSEKEEESKILPKEEAAEKEVSSTEEESLKEDLSKEEVLPPYAIEPPEEPKGKEPEEAEVLAEEDSEESPFEEPSEEPNEPLEEPLPPEEEALDPLSFEAELPEEIPEKESRKEPPAPSEESIEGPFSKKEMSSFPKEELKAEKKEEKLQLFTPEEIEEEEKEIDLALERKVQEKTERRGKEKEKESSSKDFPEKEPLEVKKEKEFSKKESPVLPKKEIKVSQSKPTKEKEMPLEEEGPEKKPPIPLSGKKKEDFSGKAEKKEVKGPVKEKVVAPEISKKKEEKKTIPPVKKEEPHVTRKKSASEDLLEALMTLKQGNQKDSSKKVKPEVLSSKKEGFSEKAIDQAKKEIKQTDSIDSLIEKAGEDLEEINGEIHSFSEESRLYFAFVYDEKKESSFIQGVIKENNKDDFVFSERIYSKEEKEASLLSFIYVLNLMKECACYKVFTNSSYLVMPFVRGFLERWMKNGWLREDGYPVSYQDKWLTIYQIMKEKRIEIVHSQKNQTTKRQMQKAENFRKSA